MISSPFFKSFKVNFHVLLFLDIFGGHHTVLFLIPPQCAKHQMGYGSIVLLHELKRSKDTTSAAMPSYKSQDSNHESWGPKAGHSGISGYGEKSYTVFGSHW